MDRQSRHQDSAAPSHAIRGARKEKAAFDIAAITVTVQWTTQALFDLSRLYDFLATRNRNAAAQTVQTLSDGPTYLVQNPQIGERLSEFEPREVRRILVGDYELRYEIRDARIYVLRLWHTREDR